MEGTIHAFVFPDEAGTNLSTPEGWKAELVLANTLITTPDHQTVSRR